MAASPAPRSSSQDYYEKNPNQPYCAAQIPPKLEKVREKFSGKVRGVQ